MGTIELFKSSKTKYSCLLLISIMIALYGIENSSVVNIIGSHRFNYLVKPTIWTVLAVIAWSIPHIRPNAKLKHRGNINLWAFSFAIVFILVSIVAGLFDGLGRSPYSHSVSGIFYNLVFVVPKLVAVELVRNHLVNKLAKEEKYYIFIPIAILMTLMSFQLSRFFRLTSFISIVQFMGHFFAPEFCHNLFATYLVFLGGPITSIIYVGILQAFHWLSPILPNLQWITTAIIGILLPMFFLISIQSIHLKQKKKLKLRHIEKESPISWISTSVLSILIVWFSVGVFPIYPSAVATGSMEPMIYPGDVILVKQNISVADLQVGDVIQFRRGNILITHRIIEIQKERESIVGFRTKGDNNSVADKELVKPEYVKGKIEHVVPKIGWPTLFFRGSRKVTNLEDIVF